MCSPIFLRIFSYLPIFAYICHICPQGSCSMSLGTHATCNGLVHQGTIDDDGGQSSNMEEWDNIGEYEMIELGEVFPAAAGAFCAFWILHSWILCLLIGLARSSRLPQMHLFDKAQPSWNVVKYIRLGGVFPAGTGALFLARSGVPNIVYEVIHADTQ